MIFDNDASRKEVYAYIRRLLDQLDAGNAYLSAVEYLENLYKTDFHNCDPNSVIAELLRHALLADMHAVLMDSVVADKESRLSMFRVKPRPGVN
jgi:hypothetical protein